MASWEWAVFLNERDLTWHLFDLHKFIGGTRILVKKKIGQSVCVCMKIRVSWIRCKSKGNKTETYFEKI